MKKLLDYMLESLLNESDENKNDKGSENTGKIKELKSKIVNALSKQTDLKSFVGLINRILEKASSDDNAALWYEALKTLFDGQEDNGIEEVQYEAQSENIPVSKLYPTQSEIDITNSAKWTDPTNLNKYNAIYNIFKQDDFGASFGCPVLVYNDGKKYWIIDGHHRWSQVALLNPMGGLACLVVTGSEKVQDFLKVTQGAMASVIANRELNNIPSKTKGLPVGDAKPENNIFGKALEGDALAARVKKLFEDKKTSELVVEKFNEASKDQDIKNKLEKIGVNEITSVDDVAKLVTSNRDKMIERKQVPENWAAPRPVMPQTDKGSVKGEKDESPAPDVDGTALNKIKNGAMPKLS